jgi:glyoxylase-like metal-dependent hydrolase (beta-lactamase superfamily II)
MFDGGSIRLPLRNHIMRAENGDQMISTPVIWFVITHPRGNVIIDGGNAAEVAIDARAHWGAILDTSTPIFTSDQAVLPSLERAGISPESIRWILQTHLHIDHTGAVLHAHSEASYDLFGDGTVRGWHSPGHSVGHQSFEVRLPSGTTYLLLGDAANTTAHFEELVQPGTLLDAVATQRSIRKLRRLAWRSQATVIPGHDPELSPTLKHAPEFYE